MKGCARSYNFRERPINGKLAVWTGHTAVLSIETQGSWVEHGASVARDCQWPRFSNTLTKARP
jgi:hypothetical protein